VELLDPLAVASGALVALGVVGLLVGSFLNVVVWRVPRGGSVVAPPSACPSCDTRIRARDNVPVVSWLVLQGRCRDCSTPISARYPLVEASTGVLFALVGLRFGPSWALPAFLYLAAIAVALALIDLDTHRLPDAIVLPAYPVTAALLVLASWGTQDWGALVRAGIGGAVLFGLYFALAVAKPGGMGFGDVKLAGVLGGALAWIGWGALVVGGFAAFLLGGLFSIGLLLTKRAGRTSGIPFGPWMLLGAAVGVAVGEPLWQGYLRLIGV
jgi:leader peptidase (prepilin peptidase) / N-methyltransferase